MALRRFIAVDDLATANLGRTQKYVSWWVSVKHRIRLCHADRKRDKKVCIMRQSCACEPVLIFRCGILKAASTLKPRERCPIKQAFLTE